MNKYRITNPNNKEVREYKSRTTGATSGREGYQSSEFQSLKNKGPIPEGSYMLGETQLYSSTSTGDRLKGHIGLGKWPGGKNSWGDTRTWLIPMKGTNTLGRGNFSIHGGKTPGSAGCIDLTNNNNGFHNWLKSYGKPIQLNVKY